VSRALTWAVIIGLGLLGAALLASTVASSSSLAVPLVTWSAIVFVGVVFVTFAIARRSKGWSLRHPGGGPRPPR
jgi:hypothetical protein